MKRFGWMLMLMLSVALGLCAQAQETPKDDKKADAPKADAKEVAVIQTSEGTMVIEFWPEVAPKTVENFKKLAREGFYDGTASHRMIPGFMLQLGDNNTKDSSKESKYGQGDPGYKIQAEFSDRKHVRGVVSMARNGDPRERLGEMPRPEYANSAGSQFFICFGPATSLDARYTAFGKVIRGEDTLAKIEKVPVESNPYSREPSKPKKRIAVDSIKIVPADSVK